MAADNRIVAGMAFNPRFSTPDPNLYHTVRVGDTLASIASRYQLTERALVDANPNVQRLGHVQAGMAIIIPQRME